jgi:energy-coupling factor transporter ATP-binding protein EcfA2
MTTANKAQIVQKAIEIWKNDLYKHGYDQLAQNNPTEEELSENGFIQTAKSMLMRDNHKAYVESEFVDVPQDFYFDVELGLEQGTFVSGGRGCGKSSLTKTMVDVFLKQGYVIKVFDNSQTWRRSSIANLAIIKPYGKFEPQYDQSYVFDISMLSLEQQKSFIENIVDNDFNYTASLNENERNWRIYVFEEAELLIGTYDHSKTILRLVATGRNLKLSHIAVAQRFAMVSTNLISLCGQLYLGMMHEQNDLKKAYNWLGNNTKELRKLDVGEFVRYSKGNVAKMTAELFATETKPKLISVESKPIFPQPTKAKEQINAMPFLRVGMVGGFVLLFLYVISKIR